VSCFLLSKLSVLLTYFPLFVSIDGRDVEVDKAPSLTSATECVSSPVDIERHQPQQSSTTMFSKASSSPARRDGDAVAVGGQSRQSYASVVSTRQDITPGSIDLPCLGESEWLVFCGEV